MNIYIGGDSFCHWRSDIENHWPAIVASKLNKPLHGEGFNGMGFWPVRQNLLMYKNSKYFDDTDLFVICHSEPSRTLSRTLSVLPQCIIGTASLLSKKDQDNMIEMYFKYIHDDEVQAWVYNMWLNELNSLLAGKKVIHLPCFYKSKELVDEISFGAKIDIPLMNIGVIKILHSQHKSYRDWLSRSENMPKEWFDLPYNHFDARTNNQIAQYVIDVYNDMNETTNKTYPIIMDKH